MATKTETREKLFHKVVDIELSIVIPCYGSANVVGRLIERIEAAMAEMGRSFEILIVNDCSPDNLSEVMEGLLAQHPNCRFFELQYNVGQFRALMCGLEHARGAFVVTIDDDLQHPPEEICNLYYELQQAPALDVVIGSPKTKRHSLLRNVGSRFVREMDAAIFGKPRELRMSSFRCMRRSLVLALLQNRTVYPVMGPLILSTTKRIRNVEFEHHDGGKEESAYGVRKLVTATLDNVLNFSTLPLQMTCVLGILVSGASFCIAGLYLIICLTRGIAVPGWTSQFLATNFYSGIILLALSVIGEYLIRILGESKGQPRYVVRRQLEGGDQAE